MRNSKELLKNRKGKEANEFYILNSFLKKVPMSVAFFSLEGDLLKSNTHFNNKLGLTKADLNEFSISKLFKKESDLNNKLSDKVEINGQYFNDEIEFERKDKSTIWLKISIFHERYPFNRSKILTLVANDITVTKKALKRSNDAKSILDSIYENTYEGIYRKNDARRIEYANSSFLKLFGYKSLKEIPDRSFSSLYADSSIVEELDLRLIKTGSIRNEKILFKKSTGETFWGLKNAAKSISPTGEINYNGAIIDIDNEVKNDALLKQKNDELRVAKEQLDRLLYSASHDLKSPISGMLGLLNLMDMDYGNDHEIHEYLKLLRDCTRRLDGIVDGISNYTLNTRERLRDEAIDVVDLVDGVWEDLKQLYGSEPISFSLKNISNNPSFYSDSGRLKVVIKNILSNSIIYRDEMKKESCIGVELDYQNDHQIITITDNGIGIAKSHVDQVCGMFYKANNKVSGTGLGLYIARETILKLNGSIYITSELQEGTKVVLSIPNSSKGKLILKKRRFKITGQHKPSLK